MLLTKACCQFFYVKPEVTIVYSFYLYINFYQIFKNCYFCIEVLLMQLDIPDKSGKGVLMNSIISVNLKIYNWILSNM